MNELVFTTISSRFVTISTASYTKIFVGIHGIQDIHGTHGFVTPDDHPTTEMFPPPSFFRGRHHLTGGETERMSSPVTRDHTE